MPRMLQRAFHRCAWNIHERQADERTCRDRRLEDSGLRYTVTPQSHERSQRLTAQVAPFRDTLQQRKQALNPFRDGMRRCAREAEADAVAPILASWSSGWVERLSGEQGDA